VPQTPPAPPLPPTPSLGEVDAFRVAMHDAVQAVANEVYPQSAQMAHETGGPIVSFVFLDGAVSDVTLVQSSGYPLLDQAAMQAVRIAQYPAEPADFRGQPHTVTVEVDFRLAASNPDSE
jgi:protein TonB